MRDGFVSNGRDNLLQQIVATFGESENAVLTNVTSVGKAVDRMLTDIDSAQF